MQRVTSEFWKTCYVLVAVLCSGFSYAGPIDSLTTLIENEKDLKTKAALLINRSGKWNSSGEYKKSALSLYPLFGIIDELGTDELSTLYFTLGVGHYERGNYDSSVFYLEKSEFDTTNFESTHQLGSNYITRGSAYFSLGKVELATEYFEKARKVFLENKDTVWVIKASLNLSVAYSRQEKPIEQLTTLKEAQRILKERTDERTLMILNAQLGRAFSFAGFTDSSLWYYAKALKMAEEAQDSVSVAIYYGNMSQMHTNIEQYAEAKTYAKRAIALNGELKRSKGLMYSHFAMGRILDDENEDEASLYHYRISEKYGRGTTNSMLASIYTNMGIVFDDLEERDSALFYLTRAMKMERSLGETSILSGLYTAFGRLYIDFGNLNVASQYLDSALGSALKVNIHRKVSDTYLALSELESEKGNVEKAFAYYKSYNIYSDSFLGQERLLNTQFLSSLHEKEKKDAAIIEFKRIEKIAKLELSNVKQQRWSLMAISASLVMVGLILIRGYSRKKRDNQQLRKANDLVTEKNLQLETLNGEIYHRAKNNLQTISSLLSLQRFEVNNENARELILENRNRVNAMALINKRLFSKERLEKITVSSFLVEITQELAYTYGIDDSVFQIEDRAANQAFDADKAVPVSLIINELISNAIKYSVPENSNPEIRIAISAADGRFNFSIKDNGPGFTEGFDTKNEDSFGWEMMNMMVDQLQGEIKGFNEQGAMVLVSFPIN